MSESWKDSKSVQDIFVQETPQKKVRRLNKSYYLDPSVSGAPLDYSFRKVNNFKDLESGTPREFRVGIPKKTSSGKYISRSLWANYNSLTSLSSISSLINVSFHKPELVGWLDVSYNDIDAISPEILTLKNLKILYLHGNNIKYFAEIYKLKQLKFLRKLTLHGNPIEDDTNYRNIITKAIPHLVNLDFSVIIR